MQNLTVFLLYFLAFALCMMMLKQGLSQSVDFLSFRNFYLLGFIVYQLISPADALRTENFTVFQVSAPEQTGRIFLLYAYLFVGVFLFSYHKFKPCRWFAKKFPAPQREISDSMFLGLAVALVCIAIPLRLFGPSIPLIRAASVQIAIALAIVASSIAGWVWGNRRLNLAVIAMMVLIVGSSLAVGMLGVFSRRPMLAILLGMVWGAYHRRARFIKPIKLILMLSPMLLFVVLAVSAFTAIRHNRETAKARVQDTARQMTQANVGAGTQNILGGQTCGSASLWAIESWPDKIDMRPLFSLRIMAYWYVPRYFWPEKPMSLSSDVARLARIKYVNWDKLLIPPGVIGYAVAEGGIITVVIYALFFGQLIRFIDELVHLNPLNAFIILPTACATGQTLGLARGDIAIFTNLIVLGFLTTFVLLFIASKLFGRKIQPAYGFPWPQPR